METNLTVRQWFALRVKSRREKVVAAAAHVKGFEEFLPLYRCHHRWSDRSQLVEVPLFPGYVFCRLNPEFRLPLLTIPGVLHFVGMGKTPIPIDDAEMEAIQTATGSTLGAKPYPFVGAGDRVRLETGPLAGLEGFLVQVHTQHHIVISLTILQRSVAVEIERHWAKPVDFSNAAGRLA